MFLKTHNRDSTKSLSGVHPNTPSVFFRLHIALAPNACVSHETTHSPDALPLICHLKSLALLWFYFVNDSVTLYVLLCTLTPMHFKITIKNVAILEVSSTAPCSGTGPVNPRVADYVVLVCIWLSNLPLVPHCPASSRVPLFRVHSATPRSAPSSSTSPSCSAGSTPRKRARRGAAWR